MRSLNESVFMWQSRALMEEICTLGSSAVAVYAAMTYWESRAPAGYKDKFQVSLDDIARIAGASRSTVSRILAELIAGGFVVQKTGRNGGKTNSRNVYFLPSASSVTMTPSSVTMTNTRVGHHDTTFGHHDQHACWSPRPTSKEKESKKDRGPQGSPTLSYKEENKNKASGAEQIRGALTVPDLSAEKGEEDRQKNAAEVRARITALENILASE